MSLLHLCSMRKSGRVACSPKACRLLAATALALLMLPWPNAWAQPITQTRTSSFSYLPNGMLEKETVEPDAPNLCLTTTHSYDAYGNKAGASTANCAGAAGLALFDTRASSATYAAQTATLSVNGATMSATIPAGTFATSSRVALTGNIADSASHTEAREFDPRFGEVTRLVGPNGATLATTWQLDEFGRKVLEVRADGMRSKALFCLLSGRVSDTSSNSPECASQAFATGEVPLAAVRFEHAEPQDSSGTKIGPYSRAYYDAAGRKIRTATQAFDGSAQPAGPGALIVQDADYNAHGAVVVATQPYFLATGSSTTTGSQDVGLSRTDYDALGRSTAVYAADPTTSQQTGGSQASVAFGARGSRQASKTTITFAGLDTTTTDDKGRTRKEEKNPDGKVVRVTDALGAQIVHQHDALGNLIATKDPLGNTITVVYDVRGRKVRMQDPDAGNADYCYDALGQLKAQQTSNMRGGHGTSACPVVSGAGSTAVAVGGWTTLAYDRMGRLTSRMEPEYTTTWYHDKDASGSPCGPSIGKPCQSTTSHGVTRKTYYDPLGRPVASRTDVSGGPSMASAVSFDSRGRLQTQTYPTGVRVRYGYTAGLGFLHRISNDTQFTGAAPVAASTALWEGQSYNAWGRAEKQQYANGVQSRASAEPQTGRLHSLSAGSASTNSVVHQRLHWDSVGQLSARVDGLGDGTSGIEISDSYTYDAIGRLTQHVVAGNGTPSVRTVELQYNALGMLLYKTDVGIYAYPAQGVVNGRPHAVQSVTGSLLNASYGYDGNGNVVSATGGKYRSIAYTSFNLPDSNLGLQGPAGSPKYTWQYDESHARIKETRVNGSGTRVTWYLHPDNSGGLAFERDEPAGGGVAQNRHYVGGFAVFVTEGALPVLSAAQQEPVFVAAVAAVKVEYWFRDHLGSLIATTNATGVVTARYSYDPFGKRRSVNGTYDPFGTLVVDFAPAAVAGTDRGYTGHEHLDDVGVIHMNGRVFDPTLAKFMQPDPFIQDPGNLQNYDRYSYCYNNPTTCTDPTGYYSLRRFLRAQDTFNRRPSNATAFEVVQQGKFFAPHAGYMDSLAQTKWGYTLGRIVINVVSVYCGPAYFACVAGMNYAWAGSAGATASQAARVAVISGATAYAMKAVGDATTSYTEFSDQGYMTAADKAWNVVGHAAVGCASSAAGGGSCRSGALSGGAGSLYTNYVGYNPRFEIAVMQHAMVGGVGSVLGGGKFANGAVTGTFGYLFNELMHSGYRRDGIRDDPDQRARDAGYLPTTYPNGAVCNATSSACTLGMGTDAEVGQAATVLFGGAALTAGAVVAAPVVYGGTLAIGKLDGLAAFASANGASSLSGGFMAFTYDIGVGWQANALLIRGAAAMNWTFITSASYMTQQTGAFQRELQLLTQLARSPVIKP